MKKLSKKVVFILIMVIISTMSLTAVQAANIRSDVIKNVEYTYENIPAEKAKAIINSILGIYDNTIIQSYSLCSSHNIQNGSITKTEHNYYSTSPRCKVTVSLVEYCGNGSCSYYVVLREIVSSATCH